MTDIKALLKQYEEVNAELNKQIKESGTEFIQQLFQDVFDRNQGLKVVGVVGWTMGFNDGEACYHQQYTYTGVPGWKDYPDFYGESGNFEEEFEFDEGENKHLNSECKTLEQAKSQVEAYDEIIERVFDTNFRIVATLQDDGKVNVSVDEYDCGY